MSTRITANLCALAVLIGFVDRATVRDSVDVLAPIFYALPPGVLTGLSLLSALQFAGVRRRKLALCMALLAACCGVYWFHAEFVGGRQSDSKHVGDISILFWNAATNIFPASAVSQLHENDAALIGMVEAGDSRATLEWYAANFPGYQFAHFGHGIVIGTRGKILNRRLIDLDRAGTYAQAEIELNGRKFKVIIADMDSNPFRSRWPAFQELEKLIAEQGDGPLIVMGDFNTPGDSACFDQMRADFRDALETAGSNTISTWPIPVPVLSIDHIWLSRHFRAHDARLGWSWTSDHRPVMSSVSFFDK